VLGLAFLFVGIFGLLSSGIAEPSRHMAVVSCYLS
jgi:hypothetical protein